MAQATPTQTQAVTKKAALLPAPVVALMQSLVPDCNALLPGDITPEQFRAALWLELTGRPSLHDCSGQSLRECVVKAATYGLLPGRDCHLLPFRQGKSGGRVATFVPNYFGLILALERTGKVAKAFAHPVYTGDEFVIDYLADVYKHIPAVTLNKPPGPLRFFYGCVRLKDGTTHIEVMDEAQVDAVRRRAPAHDAGPWVDDYLMMARKTALKRVAKYVRLTPEQYSMLTDDDERERQDIPLDRHRKNIVDLFGKEPDDDPVAQAKPAHARTTPPDDRDSAAWETLRAHVDCADLPVEVLERIAAALSPLATATESEAHALAGEVVDWLSKTEE